MAKKGTKRAGSAKEQHKHVVRQNSAPIAAAGIRSGRDLADLMSAIISDVVTGAIQPNTANAACNAAGKLIKVVELELKHGRKTLILSDKPTRAITGSTATH